MCVLQAHLALYCFANNQVQMALKLLYRAKYLTILCHGEDHPEAAIFDVSVHNANACITGLRLRQAAVIVASENNVGDKHVVDKHWSHAARCRRF
jgi:hypothetical protein